MTMSARALIGTRKGLIELQRGPAGWTQAARHFSGDPVSMVLHDPRDGSQYVALNLGHFGAKLHRRDQGADSWTEIAVPAYPPKPDDYKDEVSWTLKQVWSLAAGGADQPGELWAGTLPGGLFHSTDRGASWQLERALWDQPGRAEWMGGGYDVPGIHSICVDPRDSAHILVGVSCGGVWASKDRGASWALSARGMRADFMPPERAYDEGIQDPHRIDRCTSAPDTLWCQHHNGIFKSIDDGATWSAVTAPELPADFGFAVAVHPRDPLTAWFVPAVADQNRIAVDTALCVTRTRDGGKSFETLRAGLPQKGCYDLIYRHGLIVSDDGTTLLMGSTTGGLWISEDGGEYWQTLSNTLPPIYALAFG
jgi:hypothetical protein